MAKIKALNTIPSDIKIALEGFIEEIRRIPDCSEKLKGLEVIREEALYDDETAVVFINRF